MACRTQANTSTAAETSRAHPLTLSILFNVSELIRPIHSCSFSRLVHTGRSELLCRLPSTVQIIWVMSRSTHMTHIILTSRTRHERDTRRPMCMCVSRSSTPNFPAIFIRIQNNPRFQRSFFIFVKMNVWC